MRNTVQHQVPYVDRDGEGDRVDGAGGEGLAGDRFLLAIDVDGDVTGADGFHGDPDGARGTGNVDCVAVRTVLQGYCVYLGSDIDIGNGTVDRELSNRQLVDQRNSVRQGVIVTVLRQGSVSVAEIQIAGEA